MVQPASLRQLVTYFLKLGSVGFGGPAALIHHMHQDLVEKRKWVTAEEFHEGFAVAQLCPGPIAAQLAMYLGWHKAKIRGATLVGIAFILPSFLMTLSLAYLYMIYGSLPWITSLLYTVGAAVIGIIINSTFKLVKKIVGHDKLLLGIWLVSALITAITEAEYLWFFLLAGVFAVIIKSPPKINSINSISALPAILLYFTKAGLFIFGSGLAIVPFLHEGVVHEFGWLTERQFLDAVAVAMITPGPVVITAAFVGCLVAGAEGAVAATVGTFLPCYLLTLILAPRFNRLAQYPRAKIFVSGLTTAAIGAIGGACWILGKKAIVDVPTALIAATTLYLLLRTKIAEPFIVLGSGLLGVALYLTRLL